MSWQDDLRGKKRNQDQEARKKLDAKVAEAKAEEERKGAIRAKAQEFWDELVALNDSLGPELRLDYNARG